MRALMLLGLFALGGCAVSAKQITGPDGRAAYVMKCSGYGRDRASCLAKAGEICPAGYAVVDDSSSTSGAMLIGNTVAVAHRDYLTISCK